MLKLKNWYPFRLCGIPYIGPYSAGPKLVLFLRVALINAGVRGAGVLRIVLKRMYHVFEITHLECTLSFLLI